MRPCSVVLGLSLLPSPLTMNTNMHVCFSPATCSSARLNQGTVCIGDLQESLPIVGNTAHLLRHIFLLLEPVLSLLVLGMMTYKNSSFEWNKSKFLGISYHDGTFCSLLQSRRVSWPNSIWGDYIQLTESDQWQLLHFIVGQSSTQGFKFVM